MVWKLYRMMAIILFRCVVITCFGHYGSYQLDVQIERLNRLNRIIKCIRQYYGLHPKFVKDTYGTVENYLRQHVSEQDWVLLNQLHVIKPMHTPVHHKPVLDIA